VRTPAVALQALALGEALGAIPRQRADVTVLELEGARVEVVEGGPEGACGVVIAECGSLPPAVTSLGVTGER
jgi:hypothetical protein